MLNILILVFAVWRISYALVHEDGPYALFAVLRYRLGVREENDMTYVEWIDNKHRYTLGGLFACVYCMSVWVGILFASLYLVHEQAATVAALPFALSGAALVVHRIANP